MDPLVLRTLPEREMRSGAAEVIKYGAIRSRALFDSVASDGLPLSEVIYECCQIKAEIVARDERDQGERALLNFGHTFGHAIEKLSGFETYRHGEAVALGMTLAAVVGEKLELTEPGTANALRRSLTRHGLDTDYPGDVTSLLPALAMDKKSGSDGVRMVLLRRLGEAFTHKLSFPDLAAALERPR
jgi:3-dehydroquinate synthase